VTVSVVHMFAKTDKLEGTVLNVCSNSLQNWTHDLSPFILGPCSLWGGYQSQNMENAWQFTKVYAQHLNDNSEPNEEWWAWAKAGWADTKAHRYPMGRGARPEYAWWDGRKLGYVQARKVIYGPLYAKAVRETEGFRTLRKLHKEGHHLFLRDWDGRRTDETMTEVLNNPRRKMGHAFVLKMLLEDDPALEQFEW
jgi:hypothetical protein